MRKFGDPVLRAKGARVEKITPEISRLVADMFETMKAASGIGLAAQQVGHALQLMVVDVRGVKERPYTMEMNGEPIQAAKYMPLALINPEVTPSGPKVDGPEGCLSFPEIFSDIERPDVVGVKGLDENGKPIEFVASGLLARVIQHELDHLNGILFIDRMRRADRQSVKGQIEEIQAETKAQLSGR